MSSLSNIKASFTKRKSNFTFTETDLLLTEIENNKDLLMSPPGVANNKQYKRHIWENITAQINAIGEGDERTMEEIRKKWSDMMHLVKRKCSKGKQDLNDIELRVMALKCESDVWSLNALSDAASSTSRVTPDLDSMSSTSGGEIQIKQEVTDEEYDHPQVYFNGVRSPSPMSPEKNGHTENDCDDDEDDDDDDDDDYPETPIHYEYDSAARKRKSNFSMSERSAMVGGVRKRRSIILSKANDMATHEKKRVAWDNITAEINRAGKGDYRTVEEVRKKWNDMQSLARRKKRQAMEIALLEVASNTESGVRDIDDDMGVKADASSRVEMEDGNSMDFIERVMASNYTDGADREDDFMEDNEEEEVNEDSDSNCSEWTPGSKRKSRSASTVKCRASRKGNFSTSETNILLDEIYRRRRILFSPNLDRRTGDKKRIGWTKIAKYVSTACKKEQRTAHEVRKKWSDLFTRASKYRVKQEQRDPEDVEQDVKLNDIDKVNERVLYIYDQRDEVMRHSNEEFMKSVFEEEISSDRSKSSNHGDVDHPQDVVETKDSRIIEMDDIEEDQDITGDRTDMSFFSEESPLIIENVSTIDEHVFSSMGSHPPTSSENSLDYTDDLNYDMEEEHDGEETGEREHFVFRKRKGKFTSGETTLLLALMKAHRKNLMVKTMSSEAKSKKKEIWMEITDKINQIRKGVPRSVDEVKKKWYDLQCNARKKQALQDSLMAKMKHACKLKSNTASMEGKQFVIVDSKSGDKMLSLLSPDICANVAKSNGTLNKTPDVGPEELESIKEKIGHIDVPSDKSLSISTDRIRDRIISTPNILTSMDWKVLEIAEEIAEGRKLASYAAMDHNYDYKLKKRAIGGASTTSGEVEFKVFPSGTTVELRTAVTGGDSVKAASLVSDGIDQQRLRVERKRLAVERKRLNVEQEKLRLLRRLVQLEEGKQSTAAEYLKCD